MRIVLRLTHRFMLNKSPERGQDTGSNCSFGGDLQYRLAVYVSLACDMAFILAVEAAQGLSTVTDALGNPPQHG